jgi:hypothetical protein
MGGLLPMRDRQLAVDHAPGLPVVVHNGGRRTGGYRTGRRRGRGRESEDGTGYKRADGANREDGGSEDVSPNAHDCLHAFTEVHCLDPGSAARTDFIGRDFSFTSLWLIT